MDYAAAIALRDALEAALLSGAGVSSVQIGDRTVTYHSPTEARKALNMLNRDIAAYERRAFGVNPYTSRPRWR